MCLKHETSENLGLGLSLQALVLYSVSSGCKSFYLLAFVSEFCCVSLSLSCFSD